MFKPANAPFAHDRPRRKAEDDNRQDEQRQHRHLHVVGFDFLAEIFRRAADHQARDEDREHDEDEHAVESGADAAENDFAKLNVEQRNETTERR